MFDWEDLYDNGAMNYPCHNWVNVKLKPGEVNCELEDTNWNSSPAFNLSVVRYGLSEPTVSRFELVSPKKGSHRWINRSSDLESPGSMTDALNCTKDKDSQAKMCNLFLIR
jgi:hypothetical protein